MENAHQMSNTESLLAHNPMLGFALSLLGFVMPFIQAINPYLQFIALVVSIAIGVLTVEAKLKERKIKKRK